LPVFVHNTPWSLFDVTQDTIGIGRIRLEPGETVEVQAGMPIFISAPADIEVDVDDRRLGSMRESAPFEFGSQNYSLHSLSIGTRKEDDCMKILLDGSHGGTIQIVGHKPRPSWSLGHQRVLPTDRHQGQLDLFLLGLTDLIRLADDPSVAWHESGWARLAMAWTSDAINPSDPPMALIVRHAEKLQRLLGDLERRPRRILSRTQSMTPVDRVQQLDVASVRWLSRQPGRDIYERAGPQQRILAVRRYEDLDTLENRVLRDLAYRSQGLASAYTAQYNQLRDSRRWQAVDRYSRECRKLARSLKSQKVGMPRPPIVPNYALLQDNRYRRIWKSYREIIRRMDEQDECWRWQHRLWSDFCRLLIQIVLHVRPEFQTVAESPLRIAPEQRRGHWSEVDAQSGVYIVHDENNAPVSVASVLWDLTEDHPKLGEWAAGLGAISVVHFQQLKNGKESYLLIWPLHFFGENSPGLFHIAESSNRALQESSRSNSLTNDIVLTIEGLVMVSNFSAQLDGTEPARIREGSAVAARMSSRFGGIQEDANAIGTILHSIAMRLSELPND
jgi:hypothetical protein